MMALLQHHLKAHVPSLLRQLVTSAWLMLAGKLCIEVTPASKVAYISEELCIGCGICVKVGYCAGALSVLPPPCCVCKPCREH
jgi:4Fe-4S binding domain